MRRWMIPLCMAAALLFPLWSPQRPEAEPAAAQPASVSTPAPTAAPSPAPKAPEKLIALTFDDGPGPGTLRILDALERAGGRGTFCMVGNRVEQHPATVRRVARQGSEIATHSYSHPNLARISPERLQQELNDSIRAIRKIAGISPRILRPPYGSVNDAVRRAGREQGLVIANWNIDTLDWKTRDSRSIYRHIMENARDGAIVLCHDIYPETAAAVEQAIETLAERGYRMVTVSELLEARAGGGVAGQVYYAA